MKPEPEGRHADMLLTGGTVLTMDPSGSAAEAVAIGRGRILAVGSAGDLAALAGPATEVIDLEGRTVIPGIIDTHAHMEREGLKTLRPSLAAARSVGDVLDVIARAARDAPPGTWIITMPVGQPPFYFGGPLTLVERRMPNRAELDRAAPDHPVCIAAVFTNWGEPPGYTALNSKALALLGIDRTTKVTADNVEIEREPGTGEPTGIIIDRNRRPSADFNLLRGITGFGFAERVVGLKRSLQAYNSVGTTSIYEGHGSSPETIAVYRELWQRGELTVRCHLCVSPTWASVEEGRKVLRDWLPHARGRGLGDSLLRVAGVFVGFGGNPKTAADSRAALPNTGWAGFVEWANRPEDFRTYARLAAELDLRLHTIVGDHLEDILSIFESIDAEIPLAGRRWVIEHVKLITSEQVARIRRLGLAVTTIPVYMIWKNGAALTRDMADLDRYVPHAALLEAGVAVSAGTDNIPYNPFVTLQTIVERKERKSGSVLGPAQRLDVLRALRLMTSEAGWISFEEDRKGTLAPGKFADLAVLSRNPLSTPPADLAQIKVLRTIVDGRVVHLDDA
ncbi:MAG: amidohydrolase [Hyphomicrobiaceae bacterium]